MKYKLLNSKKIYVSKKAVSYDEFDVNSPDLVRFEFTDPEKFSKYITADFIFEIAEKCDAPWLDDYEEQYLGMDKLPIAKEIAGKAMKMKKNADIRDYLEKTKELMELAIQLETCFVFSF